MERAWNKTYDRQALRKLYGADLRVNAMSATLERGKPHEQAVAIFVSGTTGQGASAALLLDQLDHEFPLIRFYARDALQRRVGRQLPLDMHGPGDQLKAEAERLLRAAAKDSTLPGEDHATH
jgi:hypothetical protein